MGSRSTRVGSLARLGATFGAFNVTAPPHPARQATTAKRNEQGEKVHPSRSLSLPVARAAPRCTFPVDALG